MPCRSYSGIKLTHGLLIVLVGVFRQVALTFVLLNGTPHQEQFYGFNHNADNSLHVTGID